VRLWRVAAVSCLSWITGGSHQCTPLAATAATKHSKRYVGLLYVPHTVYVCVGGGEGGAHSMCVRVCVCLV
jgi:hypothetical protein